MITLYVDKATNEICQIAQYIDGYTVKVYIVGSAKFRMGKQFLNLNIRQYLLVN